MELGHFLAVRMLKVGDETGDLPSIGHVSVGLGRKPTSTRSPLSDPNEPNE